jgi:acetyltransferase-like isoleucine patch superfamily enzyme
MPPDPLPSLAAQARRAPWKAANELRRYAALPLVRAYFAMQGIAWGRGWRIYGLPVVQRYRPSRIAIGDGLEMRNWFSSNPLGVVRPCLLATWAANAEIVIGHGAAMSGVTICAQTRVTLGDRVVIGANSTIVDTDFHGLEPRRRFEPGTAAPVVVEDDVFIGTQVLVLKGARIGRGSVIGAGSVVSSDIAPGVVAVGNPARAIRAVDRAMTDALRAAGR